ncbi:hypothetical protein [Magnetospirillum fulvum]|uniref:Uncharacterized protein n=1 Tax=Magnetospirillum fulvum MGU-K5 TaxID=1316936 RepID=S9SF23_MAGFU|nr:hypothetical protein [Magnetospirillum fulvum]EPY02638.1 hypothetical protein K678_04819 [Magnetospirillum fulvum MGU-K5]
MPRPDRPLTAALAALMLVLAMVVGLSVSLAPTARVALVTFASVDRASDMTVDESDPSAALIRPSLSTKLTRQPSAADGPPQGEVLRPLALLPAAATFGPLGQATAIGAGGGCYPPSASGHLTLRIPTGPPAPASRAV